jgi:hypothetical protein
LNCKICNEESSYIFDGQILNKYTVQYFKCPNCGFLQTQKPYWLKESYSDAISISDTGIMVRNNNLAKIAATILSLVCDKSGTFLDYGGGYGIFTRLMRDKGFDFYWYDKYATNLAARGFEGKVENNRYTAVTSFENFEHFENPLKEIENIFSLTDTVLFSTELVPKQTPKPNEWWYYCLEHGQHISLFSKESLEYIAEKYGYFLISNNQNLHIFSKKKISDKIFIVEKIVRKLHLECFFNQKSKADSDMHLIIDFLQNSNKKMGKK